MVYDHDFVYVSVCKFYVYLILYTLTKVFLKKVKKNKKTKLQQDIFQCSTFLTSTSRPVD